MPVDVTWEGDEVCWITFGDPSSRNALDLVALHELHQAVTFCGVARCVVLRGAGGTFSAGYDLKAVAAGGPGLGRAAQALVAHPETPAAAAFAACPCPTIAVLEGHVLGGGLELALACDLRIAADTAVLGMPPGRLGLAYSHTGIARFVEAVGVVRTRELFLTGRTIDAATAAAWGLVNEVAGAAEVAARAGALAADVAANAPRATRANKVAIDRLARAHRRVPASLAAELERARVASVHGDEFREGVTAFVERRAPSWLDKS